MRDNANGLTNHVLATSGLGFKMSSEHEKPEDNVLSVTKQLITKTFSRSDTEMIIPYVVLHLDRGYWCWDLTISILSSCFQIWGTIKIILWSHLLHVTNL